MDTLEKVIEAFRYFDKKFPREAFEKATENPEETTQLLLKEFDLMLEWAPKVQVECNI